ncbi:MAG TPA: hypothetical protein VFE79_13760 [Paraburkholderia sp.]|jgi:hypothetical protein|nr:hypothetical protein [Paraburkholderia sp.]
MPTSQPTIAEPAHSLLRDMRYTIIPHQLRGVSAGLAALALEAAPERLFAHAHCGGDTIQCHDVRAYTRPVVCVAAIHCKALLQFLGLQSRGASALGVVARSERRPGDVSIDMFKGSNGMPLEPVPLSVIERFPDSQEIARAWSTTCNFAAQRLTRAMTDPMLTSGSITPLLRRTFETIPVVVDQWFYARAVLRANA